MLHIACLNKNIEVVEILISHGININDNEDVRGFTPLVIASMMHYKEIAEFLLSHGASTNIQDKNGKMAIHHAIVPDCQGFTEFITNKIEYLNFHSRYQPSLPIVENFSDMIVLLLSNGAEKKKKK